MEKVFNTGETPSELKQKYNPEGSVLRKVQLRMLDMLIYIDGICKELNIDYMLDGGNLIGSLRHGGFIPWDDDIDILMHPRDIKKIREYLMKNPHPQYVLQNHSTDSGYYQINWDVLRDTKSEYLQDSQLHNMRKYRGVQIDIFGFESNHNFFLQKVASWIFNRLISRNYGKSKKLLKVNYFLICNVIYPILGLLKKVFGKRNVYSHSFGFGTIVPVEKEIIYPLKTVMFEGHAFSSFAKPEKYLNKIYKNFMDLPPIDKRNHHQANYKIWD